MNFDLTHCTLCPRVCGGFRDETAGTGVCAMPSLPVLARAALHYWEEPCISGTRGAGTVFFSGCSLKCVYCQNEAISQKNFGRAVSPARLREIFFELIAQGAHNIDLVNPTHFSHVVLDALAEPLPVPVVWNSGGYDRVETLQALEGKIQIFLPDFKYPDTAGALLYSSAGDYPETAKAAILEMYRQTGPYVLGDDGLLRRGVLVRHLLLPGRLARAKEVMDWVAASFPAGSVLFSLMSQYVPLGRAENYPELNRRLRNAEIRSAISYLENLGLDGYLQENAAASTDYVPGFDLTGV